MQKSGSLLSIDSRNRINTTSAPNSCIFKLQTALNASRFEVLSFSFGNTLYNVTSSTNKLYINGVLAATTTPGFWAAAAFVTDLETQLETFYGGGSGYVAYNATTNVLTWNLGGGQSISSGTTMNSILGIIGVPVNSFTSNLFLVGATALSIQCPQLQCFSYNSFDSTARVSIVIAVDSGYGSFQVSYPKRGSELQFSKLQADTLQFTITDARNDQLVNIGEWNLIFLVS